MADRYYTFLECGCLVSCDGGGGLMPCEKEFPECKLEEYMKKHIMIGGCCKECDPEGYKKEKEYWDKHPETEV